ncbi:hypothetical protein DEU34_1732 [Microbacterium sp. AG1240]|uniref:hypothetical protein n=1 Tax=Microbacterium sp. AG1240 TaxID=2183992 RepID=UPI000F243C4E|nr:hypothetical protein [Microbacterium sp. AG1240]RKT33142.1 hypothetical protein DEU34_1732 [Microbacterium sp. AG1240]
MTDIRKRRQRPAVSLLPLAVLLAACTAGGSTDPDSATTPPPVAPPSSPRASPEPTSLVIPGVSEGEVARAEFVTGADGIPSASSIAEDTVTDGGIYTVEGACTGTRAAYKVETAVAGDDRRNLTSSSIRCDEPYRSTFTVTGYDGVVQLSFTDTDLMETGWVRVLPAGTP